MLEGIQVTRKSTLDLIKTKSLVLVQVIQTQHGNSLYYSVLIDYECCTKCHKFGGLNNSNLLSHNFRS